MSLLLYGENLALVRGGRLLFEGLDIALAPGETLHVTGPNGCGKSSLLRLVAGLLRPTAGRIERAAVALADEKLALDRELPLIGSLSDWMSLNGTPQRLEFALNTLNLAGLSPVPVRILSTGQLKRATLARVAASTAPLWLLDEPLNGLDASGVDDLAALIDAHTAAGGAVMAASHSTLPGQWRRLELGR